MIEILYRGYSHWSMFLLAGGVGIAIGLINEFLPWDTPLASQAMIGAIVATIFEFIVGVIVNIILGLNIWDYSNLDFNFMGQICLQFSIAWYFLSILAIILDDYLRYWLFGEEKPRYKIL